MCKHIYLILFIFLVQVFKSESAKILVFIPTASFSHQVVIRPLTQELAKRGHEVVVITANLAFTKDNAPKNLKEIDVHDIAYKTTNDGFANTITGSSNDIYGQITTFSKVMQDTFEAVVTTEEVQILLKNREHFDLLILEGCVKPVLIFSHIFKAPVILFSSIPAYDAMHKYTGAATHPLLFPSFVHQRINNLTMWEKVKEVHRHYYLENVLGGEVTEMGDSTLRRLFGNDVPKLDDLAKNVDMVFLAEHHIWDSNRPVPPTVVFVGGIYPSDDDSTVLAEDLHEYLNSSKTGVIYMSFGTNLKTSLLSEETVDMFVKVLSKLPYNVLLKWNIKETWRDFSKNVKIVEWVPQPTLLRHPNIKLFITQGGLQSISDTLNAGVPIVGLPMLGDQWFNIEQCERLKIGKRLDVESLTEDKMFDAVTSVIEDDSYRENSRHLRILLRDQPQSALERAVWWAEYVIRNNGASHLRAPTALISNWEYFEGDLICAILFVTVLLLIIVVTGIWVLLLMCQSDLKNLSKIKAN